MDTSTNHANIHSYGSHNYHWCLQGSPVWMEHAAAIDVPGMEAAGISLEDFVYYHCRVSAHCGFCNHASTMHLCRRCMCCQLAPEFFWCTLQAMEYMVNCKYVEASAKCGHPVDSHCVILVSSFPRQQHLHCLHHCCCAHVSVSLAA
jgi:hypothetical protein